MDWMPSKKNVGKHQERIWFALRKPGGNQTGTKEDNLLGKLETGIQQNDNKMLLILSLNVNYK